MSPTSSVQHSLVILLTFAKLLSFENYPAVDKSVNFFDYKVRIFVPITEDLGDKYRS